MKVKISFNDESSLSFRDIYSTSYFAIYRTIDFLFYITDIFSCSYSRFKPVLRLVIDDCFVKIDIYALTMLKHAWGAHIWQFC